MTMTVALIFPKLFYHFIMA